MEVWRSQQILRVQMRNPPQYLKYLKNKGTFIVGFLFKMKLLPEAMVGGWVSPLDIYIFFSPKEVKLQPTYGEINQASHLSCLIEF